MTQEEKQLLLKDLCGRLPYMVMVSVQGGEFEFYKYPYRLTAVSKFGLDGFRKVYHPIYAPFDNVPNVEDVKPYLRPMSSMTEEEREEFRVVGGVMSHNLQNDSWAISAFAPEAYDWLNAHHFDFRGLISMGLALEAKEGMYKTE